MAGIKGIYYKFNEFIIWLIQRNAITQCILTMNNFIFHMPNYIGKIALIGLAFAGSLGMTLLVLGCALPQFNNWWPFFVVFFYVLAPIPLLISRRYSDDMSSSNAGQELALFLTTALIISAFGLPIILARAPQTLPTIEWGSCWLVLSGNVVVFLTILGFFMAFDNDDIDYSMW